MADLLCLYNLGLSVVCVAYAVVYLHCLFICYPRFKSNSSFEIRAKIAILFVDGVLCVSPSPAPAESVWCLVTVSRIYLARAVRMRTFCKQMNMCSCTPTDGRIVRCH